jgi:hypothetical protein
MIKTALMRIGQSYGGGVYHKPSGKTQCLFFVLSRFVYSNEQAINAEFSKALVRVNCLTGVEKRLIIVTKL